MRKTTQWCLFMPLFLFAWQLAVAQGAGIGTTNPHASAALHILEENNKGVLIPRMAVASEAVVADGMIVYNTTTGNLSYSNSGVWTEIVPVPSGTVIMWNYNQGGIPDGWVLCDGRHYSLQGIPGSGIRTPDLRGYFIAGYSGAGSYAAIGANADGKKYVQLSEAEMPAHTHAVSDPGHNHSISVAANPHSHDFVVEDTEKSNTGVFPNPGAAPFPGIYYSMSAGAKVTGNVITGVTVNSGITGVSVNATGSGQGHENRPPYYVLAFIMKL